MQGQPIEISIELYEFLQGKGDWLKRDFPRVYKHLVELQPIGGFRFAIAP